MGLVTVTAAFPDPSEQSVVCAGAAGDPGAVFITTLADGAEIHPVAFVTVKLYEPVIRLITV